MSEHDEIRSFYDTVYYRDAGTRVSASGHLRRMASKYVHPGDQVLDIACGTGNWLMAACERGAIPAGIDLSPKAIDICKHNMPDGEFVSGPAESLPFADNSYDVVTCLGSLEHFLDPVAAVCEMVRVAKNDAAFIILVPNSGFLTRRLGLYRGTYQTAAKEEVRSLDEWQQIFAAGGLRTLRRWKDLHVLSWPWIMNAGWLRAPVRALQAVALASWPLSWQYQVYHLLEKETS
ncbi:MAG: class I SAM-dependent methyltransferase [Gammaproteobacteria bacterium]